MTGKPVKEILSMGSVTTGQTHCDTSGNLERDGRREGSEKPRPELVSVRPKPYHPTSVKESGGVRKECFQCPNRCRFGSFTEN